MEAGTIMYRTIFSINVLIFTLKIYIKGFLNAESRVFSEWVTNEKVLIIQRIKKQLKTYYRVGLCYTEEEIFSDIFFEIISTIKGKKIKKKGKSRSLIENYEAYFMQSVNFYLNKLHNRMKLDVDINSQLQRFSEPFHLDQYDITSLDYVLLGVALTTLKEKHPVQYQVFMLRAYDEKDYCEIAQILDLSVDNVRQIYRRARAKLQDVLLAGQRT
jgi:RNA polymerase sigma factor (sigma-70 family)